MNYIYVLIDPVSNEIRYVGKTTNPRGRLRQHINHAKRGERTHRDNWINVLLRNGSEPVFETIDVVSDAYWDKAEQKWVSLFKNSGCRLTNMTEGGDKGGSTLGFKHSPETKDLLTDIRRSHWAKIHENSTHCRK